MAVIAEFTFRELPDEWDIVWPLVMADKLPTDAWDYLDKTTSKLHCEWSSDVYAYKVRITAKFNSEHDELIYKLKYPC